MYIAYSIVWRARERQSGKIIALKQLHPDIGGTACSLSPPVAREIGLLWNHKHDNIIGLHRIATEDGTDTENSAGLLYLVMEYVDLVGSYANSRSSAN
jgi:serine/threonine protein kinase